MLCELVNKKKNKKRKYVIGSLKIERSLKEIHEIIYISEFLND